MRTNGRQQAKKCCRRESWGDIRWCYAYVYDIYIYIYIYACIHIYIYEYICKYIDIHRWHTLVLCIRIWYVCSMCTYMIYIMHTYICIRIYYGSMQYAYVYDMVLCTYMWYIYLYIHMFKYIYEDGRPTAGKGVLQAKKQMHVHAHVRRRRSAGWNAKGHVGKKSTYKYKVKEKCMYSVCKTKGHCRRERLLNFWKVQLKVVVCRLKRKHVYDAYVRRNSAAGGSAEAVHAVQFLKFSSKVVVCSKWSSELTFRECYTCQTLGLIALINSPPHLLPHPPPTRADWVCLRCTQARWAPWALSPPSQAHTHHSLPPTHHFLCLPALYHEYL